MTQVIDEVPETGSHATRRGVSLYDSNPFMLDIKTRTRRVTNKRGDMMLVNTNGGEIAAPIAGFWEAEEVDSTRFIKLFVNGVKALKELTGPGTKVFEVLYLRVQDNAIGKDRVFMSYSDVNKQITPMSPSTYKRGLAELIEKRFVAATPVQGWYWLNPDFVFNGDRLAFVKEFRLKSAKMSQVDNKTMQLDFDGQNADRAPQVA